MEFGIMLRSISGILTASRDFFRDIVPQDDDEFERVAQILDLLNELLMEINALLGGNRDGSQPNS